MSWSEGNTMMVAFGFLAAMSPTPNATAGAVSRLAGSAKMFSAGSSEATSRTACSCRALVRMRIFSLGISPSSLLIVWLRRVASPKRLSNCFGLAFLDSGQKRVPLPPAKIKANWLGFISVAVLVALLMGQTMGENFSMKKEKRSN